MYASWEAEHVVTWHPTPMKRRRLRSSLSAMASMFRFGDRIDFTPLAMMMSSLQRTTTCTAHGACLLYINT